MRLVCLTLLLYCIIVGCTQKQEPLQQAPTLGSGQAASYVASVEITTSNPTVDKPLVAHYVANSIESKQVIFRFHWYVDGMLVPGADTNTLEQSAFSKGARIYAEVVPVIDGVEGSASRSADVIIQNALPLLTSLDLTPSPAYPGDKITALATGLDSDKNDTVTFLYEWQVDGQTLAGAENQMLDTSHLKKKNAVFVTVTPFDGQDKGPSLQSSRGVVLSNRAPEFVSIPPSKLENNIFVYQAVAKDPDGDSLTYGLVDAPSGMTINSLTGLIRWELPVKIAEKQQIKVKVSTDDGDGAAAFQEFFLSLEKK